MNEIIARLMAAIETPDDLTQGDIKCLLEDAHIVLQELKMSRDTFEAKGDACHLTERQKQFLRDAKENGEGLADPDGDWQHDLAAVCETGSMIVYLLERAFPFLDEGDKDGLTN